MDTSKSASIVILLLIGIANCIPQDEDLIAVETSNVENKQYVISDNEHSHDVRKQTNQRSQIRINKYSSRIESKNYPVTETQYGYRTSVINRENPSRNNKVDGADRRNNAVSSSTEAVLDFRIRAEEEARENEVDSGKQKNEEEKKENMKMAGATNGKQKKETAKSDEEDEEKNLAQQVADGKYGLIQNEIFANGSKRPGILSYLPNSEVPKDTKENFGGLEKDEIWLAEDHVLVLKGGRFPDVHENEAPQTANWPPIDDYVAPTRQVKIPENPKIAPPFPIQLTEDGPVEFVKGENGPPPNFPIPPYPPIPLRPNGTLQYPPPIFFPPPDRIPNATFPFPGPPGPLPPFLANFPPGAAFLPPPGNITDFDEDDPSIYYPPKYDFHYQQDNTTVVPPGPLVPGIVLPPPPDFFAPLNNDTEPGVTHEENRSEDNSVYSTEPPYVAPGYLPANRKPSKPRTYIKRPSKRPSTTPPSANVNDIYNQIIETSPSPESHKGTITYVYPENSKRKQTTSLPFDSLRTTKVASYNAPDDPNINGFASPVYVPNDGKRPVYQPIPTTSPKPNHITIPTSKTLSKEIYIVTKQPPADKNREDSQRIPKPVKTDKYEHLSPELHPLRSLIRPNVSVSYIGKYGHLPAATPFPFPKKPHTTSEPIRGGHYITQFPDVKENVISTASPEFNGVTVTPIPVVKKIRVRPVLPDQPQIVTSSMNPSKATFYFYEEQSVTDNPVVTTPEPQETVKEKPLTVVEQPKAEVQPQTQYYSTLTNGKTPIRQYLEETFHSSNVLQNKPQIAHLTNADVPHHGVYSPDIPKMKHLNYRPQIPRKPAIKYHYVTESYSPAVPKHKIKTLEIENSGSTGLQTVKTGHSVVSTTPKPYTPQTLFTTTFQPDKANPNLTPTQATTVPTPVDYKNTDGPFVPSNYYATARPENLQFTPPDHSLVDDITQNYFTIFGQKINSVSTTPLTPIKPPVTQSLQPKPQSGLSYVSDVSNNFHIQQIHKNPPKTNAPDYYTTDKGKYLRIVTTSPRPKSNFEQYLKEITGVDQKDFIIAGVAPAKLKKGKGFTTPNPVYNPPRLQTPSPIYLTPYRQSGLLHYVDEQAPSAQLKPYYQQPPKYNFEQYTTRPKLQYRPSFATTLRPVMDVEIQPQYIQHISSTTRPFPSHQHEVLPAKVQLNHNFGQYLQELNRFTSPTTVNPVKIRPTNPGYFPTTPAPISQVSFSMSQYPEPGSQPNPPSLEGDILVNYKPQRPDVNPEAEIINVQRPIQSFDTTDNFKIVDPPDLSGKRGRLPYRSSYKPKPQTFESAKDFFENLPNSGYFSPSHQSSGNSFISYNLPGNGGHFYFLTPQIADKSDGIEDDSLSDNFGKAKRTDVRQNRHRYPSLIEQDSENQYANQDYLRRRRKKP